jgi:hypothetical protein
MTSNKTDLNFESQFDPERDVTVKQQQLQLDGLNTSTDNFGNVQSTNDYNSWPPGAQGDNMCQGRNFHHHDREEIICCVIL